MPSSSISIHVLQLSDHFSELLLKPKYTWQQYLDAVGEIRIEDIRTLAAPLLKDCRIDVLATGNLTAAEATELVQILATSAQLTSAASAPASQYAQLPPGRTVWKIDSVDEVDANHAVAMKAQMPYSLETQGMLTVVKTVLSSKFFEILRTQQQLGYVVQMSLSRNGHFVDLNCLVQTEFPPDHVHGAIDAFMDEHFEWIAQGLEDSELQQCVGGVLSSLQAKPKNLGEDFGRFHAEFNDFTHNYGRRNELIQFLSDGITLDALQQFVATTLSGARRLYLQVHKKIDQPDKELTDAERKEPNPVDREWSGKLDDVLAAFHGDADTIWLGR